MKIKLLLQESNNGCGQACVAMIAGISFKEACRLVGTTSKTRSVHLSKALEKVGIECDTKATRIKPDTVKPDLCIVRLHCKGHKESHWVVYCKGTYYDPAFGIVIRYVDPIYETSYLEVKES